MAPKKGCSTLGGFKYPDAIIAGVPSGFRVKFFLKWGGKDALSVIEKVAKSGKFPEIAIHLAAFDYKHAYPVKELMPGVIKDSKRIQAITSKYNTKFSLNAFCESNHNAPTLEGVFEDISKAAPSCDLFNSIWKGQVVNGIDTEIHLSNSKLPAKPKGPYGIDWDGYGGDGKGNSSDSDIDKTLAFYSDAKWADIWFFQANGKFGWKDGRDIASRDDYAYTELIRGHCALLEPREGKVTWSNNMLLKPFADDHDEADSKPGNKDNRFMVILPWSGNAEILDSKNNVIDKMVRMSDYNDGTLKGPRYYSKYYARQVSDLAFRKTGSRLIKIRVGTRTTPLTDARKRSGLFK